MMENKLVSQKLRDALYAYSMQLAEETKSESEFMNLLSSLWDVYNKPRREDSRFSNLGDEIEKHFVMNDDWACDKLFISILHIRDDDDKLIRFFSGLLNISTNYALLTQIQNKLESNDFHLVKNDEKWNVHIGDMTKPYIEDRSLPFYVCKSRIVSAFAFTETDVDWPIANNCFVLTFNYGWNDFSYRTRYKLYYVDEKGKINVIGNLKIMHADIGDTSTVLSGHFYSLSSDYCSLGEDVYYYENMRKIFGNKAYVYLSELCDAALYSKVYEKFENDSIFRVSLCRYNSSDKALREGRYYVYGRKMDMAFSFTYKFKPGFFLETDSPIEISFPFGYQCPAYKRIIGLIGENGVGKSSLIKDIVNGLITKGDSSFVGLKPIFAKVFVNSYSPFDHFPPVQDDYTIGYSYCGLAKKGNELLTLNEQIDQFLSDVRKVHERGSTDNIWNNWKKLANEVVPLEILSILCDKKNNLKDEGLSELKKFCTNMSSGETIFLFSISNLLAQIKPNSLLLFDEPEQHLHPQAITRLINAVFEILEIYESYAIIATHSALVIRELLSENVLIFNRNGHHLSVNRIGIETFGEDISVLNNYVFKNLNENKRYEQYVKDIVKAQDYDYDSVVNVLQNGKNQLSLSLRLLIQSFIDLKNK